MKSKLMSKKLIFSLIFSILFLSFFVSPVKAEEPQIIIDSVSINSTGMFEVVGHCTDAELNTQISFLMCPAECFDSSGYIKSDAMTDEKIIYIDQVGTGNNGTFLIKGTIDSKWSNTSARFAGASSLGGYYTQAVEIPEIPPGLEVVATNSVLYGRDIFYVNGVFYEPNNIATAISEGGNNIYFMLGRNWYNLMNENAVDNSFLVAENASSVKEVEGLKPRYYYSVNKKIKLKWS